MEMISDFLIVGIRGMDYSCLILVHVAVIVDSTSY